MVNMNQKKKMDDSNKSGKVDAPTEGRQPFRFKGSIRKLGGLWGPVIIAIVLFFIFSIINPQFASLDNIQIILSRSAVPFVLSVGMSFVIIQGGIDLSVPGIMSAGSLVVALLVSNNRNNNQLGLLGVLIAIAVGLLLGFINGFVHTRFKVPSFMATLGMFSFSYGIAMLLSGGSPPKILDENLRNLGLGHLFGVGWLVYLGLGIIIFGYLLQRFTRFGRYTYVIGGSEEIAIQSGINVALYKTLVFTLAGGLFALGGVMESARLGLGHSLIGAGQDFATITAVVVGGTLLTGGRGGIINSAIGVLIMMILADGLILIGVNPYIQNAIQGIIILVAVIGTTWQQRERLRVMK